MRVQGWLREVDAERFIMRPRRKVLSVKAATADWSPVLDAVEEDGSARSPSAHRFVPRSGHPDDQLLADTQPAVGSAHLQEAGELRGRRAVRSPRRRAISSSGESRASRIRARYSRWKSGPTPSSTRWTSSSTVAGGSAGGRSPCVARLFAAVHRRRRPHVVPGRQRDPHGPQRRGGETPPEGKPTRHEASRYPAERTSERAGNRQKRSVIVEALYRRDVRGAQLHALSVGSVGLCIGLWIRAKTVDQDERGNAERRALFVGLWAPTLWQIGDSLRLVERDAREPRRPRLPRRPAGPLTS